MEGIGGTLKNAVYHGVKSGKAFINNKKEFAEHADKIIKGIFHPCIYRVTVLSLNTRKSRQFGRFRKPLKSISLCAPWRKKRSFVSLLFLASDDDPFHVQSYPCPSVLECRHSGALRNLVPFAQFKKWGKHP